MPRLAKLGILLFVGVVAALVLLPIVSRPTSSTLYVHIDGFAWTNVCVESENLSQPLRFERFSDEMQVSPISHGIYRVSVQLADGQSIWSELFHTDVGKRRRVDLFIAPSSRPGWIHFRQTANQKDLLFEGDGISTDAIKRKPFRLGWI